MDESEIEMNNTDDWLLDYYHFLNDPYVVSYYKKDNGSIDRILKVIDLWEQFGGDEN